MTTPYCSKDQYAHRKGYANWTAYVDAGNTAPDPEELDDALEDAADIMNDSEHLNAKSTNVSNTDYTQRLERINFNMANRIMDVEHNRAFGGATFTFSIQDFLYTHERNFLITTAVELGLRAVGGVS